MTRQLHAYPTYIGTTAERNAFDPGSEAITLEWWDSDDEKPYWWDGAAWVDVATVGLPQDLGTGDSPTFAGLTVSGLTASRLLASDGAKALASVADLTSWIAGTANRVTVADDGDGTVTLSGPQDLHTGADVQFDSLILDSTGTEALLVRKDADGGDVFIVDTSTPSVIVDATAEEAFMVRRISDSQDIFVVDTNSQKARVGIGGKPEQFLHLMSSQALDVRIDSARNDNFGVQITGRRSRGTLASKLILQDDDYIYELSGRGYDGSNYIQAGALRLYVDGTPGLNDMPGRWSFDTTPDGGVAAVSRMVIDNQGNVGIGTTPSTFFHIQKSGAALAARLELARDSTFGVNLEARRSRGTIGSEVIVQDGDDLFAINAYGYDGSTQRTAAGIQMEVDGTPGASDMPGRLIFYTTTDGAAGYSEKLRINNAGLVTVESLIPSRLLSSDASKGLESVSDLTSWIAGISNQIEVTDDGDGTATLGFPDSVILDATNAEAFLIRKDSDGGDAFIVDTSNNEVIVYGDNDLVMKGNSSALDYQRYSTTAMSVSGIEFKKSATETIGTLAATAANENLGILNYYGVDSNNSAFRLAADVLVRQVGAAAASTIDGEILIRHYVSGTAYWAARFNSTAYIFNELGKDVDFRVEGDTDTHLLFVDAGAERVAINYTSTPGGKLHIAQDSAIAGIPVLYIRQDDVSEEFARVVGTAASGNLTQSLVDAGDVSTFTTAGYLKISLADLGSQITNADYWIPFGTLA